MNTTPYTHDNWDTWLAHLSAPLANSPCGEDLKYEEDFKFLKSSFSGVNELAGKKVFTIATDLLAEKSKDLRIVSYLVAGATQEFGVEGLYYGIALLNRYLQSLFDEIHPQKDKARMAVHTWLLGQQGRFIALAQQHDLALPEVLALLMQELARYGNENVRKLDENAGPLTELNQWCTKLCSKHPVIKEAPKPVEPNAVEQQSDKLILDNQAASKPLTAPSADPNELAPTSSPSHISGVSNVSSQEPVSEADYMKGVRQLLSFDKAENNIERSIALARAVRWSKLTLPPNESGKTRLPAPRATAFAPIKNALSNENFVDALWHGEKLFLEGAMHYNLDLQALVLTALKGLRLNKAEQQLTLALYQVITLSPQLMQLTYEDGTPFCSAKTQDMLHDIAKTFSQESTACAQDDVSEKIEVEGKTLIEQGKLSQALQLTQNMPVITPVDGLKQQLLKAKFCLRAERFDFAEPILSSLVEKIAQQQLALWQPDLAMQVWRNAVSCYLSLAEDNNDFAERAQQLKQKMILTQPEVALGWF
ncbi:type VI secretion system domain-containing protein [Thalassotalea ganghwensis]